MLMNNVVTFESNTEECLTDAATVIETPGIAKRDNYNFWYSSKSFVYVDKTGPKIGL